MTSTLPARISSADLNQRIGRIYDHLYANAEVRTPSGICVEVGKLLHTAMFVEEVLKKVPAFEFSRSDFKQLTAEDGEFIRQVARTARRQFAEMNAQWGFYAPDSDITVQDFDLAHACLQLAGIAVSDRKRDVFGDALEIFRSQWAKRAGGQFFTDQLVTHLAMELLEFDPLQGDDLVDICAGTGGFLLAGLNHLRNLLEAQAGAESVEARLVQLAVSSIRVRRSMATYARPRMPRSRRDWA